ncbi:MAG: acetate kinase [Hyphomicrobiales bacterium]|nr:acetate kinase [Hyphomicrobiales bacterium]
MTPVFIVLNAGSSSLKFQIFEAANDADPGVIFRGLFEGLGSTAHFVVKDRAGKTLDETSWPAAEKLGHEGAITHLVSWLRTQREGRKLVAVGHRVVHGGEAFTGPVLIDDSVLSALEGLIPLAPLHQPHNLAPIKIIRRQLPAMPQIACFDTAFHQTQPDVATLFAIPRDMRDRGVRRYGFHGLSYEYIASTLATYDRRFAAGRVIVAHLGNGASLCALNKGVSIATTMGFSALDGLPMGTRCGAIDAGAVFYMLREMKLTPAEAENILYTKSGLLGVSALSNDMRTLRANAANNVDARRAIDLFVYRITREIGSMIAALGGLDGLVFTGGIGENDVLTRAEVIAALSWAGVTLDEAANMAGGPLISTRADITAWVIPTNEEVVIARQMRSIMGSASQPAS